MVSVAAIHIVQWKMEVHPDPIQSVKLARGLVVSFSTICCTCMLTSRICPYSTPSFVIMKLFYTIFFNNLCLFVNLCLLLVFLFSICLAPSAGFGHASFAMMFINGTIFRVALGLHKGYTMQSIRVVFHILNWLHIPKYSSPKLFYVFAWCRNKVPSLIYLLSKGFPKVIHVLL